MQMTAVRRATAAPLSANSGRKALMLAAVLGLLAAFLSWSYLQQAGHGARQAATVPVVVAAADIPVRTQVTAQMLTIKQVPADARHEKAFTGLEQLDGKVTNLPIAAGEQVLNTKFFARKEDSGLAFRIPPGKRAVSVNVNEVISTGGLIVPGDFVDVVSIFNLGTGTNNQNQNGAGLQDTASLVLQNIEVLAVAQSIQGPASGPTGIAANVPGAAKTDARQEAIARPEARTATLAVTPEEAQKLILAEDRGKIRLALRGIEDRETVAVPATRVEDFRR